MNGQLFEKSIASFVLDSHEPLFNGRPVCHDQSSCMGYRLKDGIRNPMALTKKNNKTFENLQETTPYVYIESSKLVDWLWFGLCLLYRGERERVAMLLKVSHWTYRNPTQTRRKMENKWRGGREESSSFYFSQPMTAWHTQTHCEKKPMQRNQLRNQRQTTPKQTKQTQRKEERTKTPTKRNQNEQTVTRRHWGTVHKKARSP